MSASTIICSSVTEVLNEAGRGGWPFAGLHFGAIAAPRFSWRLSRRTLELSRGSKPFAKRQPKQHKTLGCGVNRPGESGDFLL